MKVAFNGFLARLQLAPEQLAEALEGDRAILKLLTGWKFRLREPHRILVAGHVADVATRDAAGEREQLADGDLGFARVSLPLGECVRDLLVELEQTVLHRHDREHADETLRAAGEPVGLITLMVIEVVLEQQLAVAIDQQRVAIAGTEVVGGGLEGAGLARRLRLSVRAPGHRKRDSDTGGSQGVHGFLSLLTMPRWQSRGNCDFASARMHPTASRHPLRHCLRLSS